MIMMDEGDFSGTGAILESILFNERIYFGCQTQDRIRSNGNGSLKL
jgi:hypothetical protein